MEVITLFYPGETDTHTFTIPFNADKIEKAIVTYKQANKFILEKTVTSFTDVLGGCQFVVLISQEESLRFIDNAAVSAQVNVYFTNHSRMTSEPVKYVVGEQYHKKVIS